MSTVAITINIDSNIVSQAQNALAWKNGYQSTINGQPNPVTLAQNAKLAVIQYVQTAISDYQHYQAAQQAAQATVPIASNLIS